jgi:putative ABC transport system permease protein
MRALDIKILRDLRRLAPQAAAIALVLACGVATLILSVGTYRSLSETRAAYYERYLFGDVFTSAVRAPNVLAPRIAEIDGVAAVETRIVKPLVIDIDTMREPASGVVISWPEHRQPAVNALFLRQGRMPEPGNAREVLITEPFAEAHGFAPGSSFAVILEGRRLDVTIVGTVLSPEYVYALGPGELMPDRRRFGIMWMSESALASLADLDGAFNSVSLRLLRGANEAMVIEGLDMILDRYGGTGGYGRKDQLSNAFLDGELVQLRGMAQIIPPIFLAVSAFLVNMILSRLVTLEREQIGLLKALGYGRFAAAFHYLKLVLLIAAFGIVIGIVAGTWLGWGMTGLYSRFYSFPFLIFDQSPDIYLIAIVVSLVAAVLGALSAVARAFQLPAAVAMQPPAPPVYRGSFWGIFERLRWFSQLTTMAMRHMLRHWMRTALTALGTSLATALLCVALGSLDSVEFMLEAVFFRTERQEATLSFSHARPPPVIQAVEHLPGVLVAEPYHVVPVRLVNGHLSRRLAITGKPPGTDLSRVLDLNLEPVLLPDTGLALGDRVAEILGLRAGDMVTVELLDGTRRVVEATVAQVIQTYIGLSVFMNIDALARLAGTGPRVSGTHLKIDSARLDGLYQAVKTTPALGSISLNAISRQLFRETMQQNMTMMLTIYFALAVIIAFGVVYNSARIQLSERARELATLRVLGFGRREVFNVLMIELATIVAIAQPLGWALGYALGYIVTQGLASDLFRVPFIVQLDTFAISSLVVVGAAAFSAAVVFRRVMTFDLVQVLKTRD